jgi:hypothetical protein
MAEPQDAAPLGREAGPDPGLGEPIQIWLAAAGGEHWPVDRPPRFEVRVRNVSEDEVWMVGVLPGSEGLRYPQYVAEIEGPSGPVTPRFPEDLDYVPGLRPEAFVRLAPGESFDPQGEGFVPIQQLAWFRPPRPGRYRLRLCFDATAGDVRLWLGHTPVPDRARVERLIRRVPPVRVWSNILEIEFD